MNKAFIVFLLSINCSIAETIKESDIAICTKDSDCIVVPYSHCCGSTKRAINRKYKSLYESKPEWQKFDNPNACALMGACLPDKNMKKAVCMGPKIKPLCQLGL
ncbi:MAG: hypothetical protein WC635_00840 [Bacteriovorax sp.]|jgi:hypothetical protein